MALPHEIYAEQLGLLGFYGHALWQANPHNEPPVDIGDIGYIEAGAWVKLFNATKPPEDISNRHGLPQDHIPLTTGRLLERSLPATQPIISHSMRVLGGEGGISNRLVVHIRGLL